MATCFTPSTRFRDDIHDSPWMFSLSQSSSAPSSPASTEPGEEMKLEIAARPFESDSYFHSHPSHSLVRVADFPSASLPRRSVVSFRKQGNQVYSSTLNNAPTYQVRGYDGGSTPYLHRLISNVSCDYDKRRESCPHPSPPASYEAAPNDNFDFSKFIITKTVLNAQPRRRSYCFAKYCKKSAKQSPSTEQQQQQPSLRRLVSKVFTRSQYAKSAKKSPYTEQQQQQPSLQRSVSKVFTRSQYANARDARLRRHHPPPSGWSCGNLSTSL